MKTSSGGPGRHGETIGARQQEWALQVAVGPLHRDEQVLVIAVAPAPAEHGADVAVDGLDGPEGDLLVAVAGT